MMVHVEVGVTHALCRRHLTKHRLRRELPPKLIEEVEFREVISGPGPSRLTNIAKRAKLANRGNHEEPCLTCR